MAKIIEINQDMVMIGMDDGSIKQVFREEVRFHPHIGDEVEIYESEDQDLIYVMKKGMTSQNNYYNNESNYSSSYHYNTNDYYYEEDQYEIVNARYVDKLLYMIICFFFGWMGGHQFYARNTKKGIIYLLFCWTGIPVFIATWDFFKALGLKSKNGQININAPVVHRKVNKVIYLVITLLGGAFGMQKFYSGEMKKGILCIVFYWTSIPFFISIYDFITALLMNTDSSGLIDKY